MNFRIGKSTAFLLIISTIHITDTQRLNQNVKYSLEYH